MNLHARAASSLDICEPAEEHERNSSLFEPRAQRRTLAIVKHVVNHRNCQVMVFSHRERVLNGAANANTGSSVLERVFNVQCDEYLVLRDKD